MSVADVITVVSCIVGLAGFAVAFFVMWSNRTKDVKVETKEQVEVHAGLQSQITTIEKVFGTRLASIDDGVRDLRADNRGMRSELTKMRDDLRDEIREIHDEAKHATELAQAAHRRLDRMGVEPDPFVKKIKQSEEKE